MTAGIYLLAGLVGLRDLIGASCSTYGALALWTFAIGFGAALATLLASLHSWKMDERLLLDVPELLERYGSLAAPELRSMILSQVGFQIRRAAVLHSHQRRWVHGALRLLTVSVASVAAFVSLAVLASVVVC